MAKVFSTEDGKLSGSVRVVKQRQYADLDLSFAARNTTDGDVYRKLDAASVKQALKNLLLTNRFEKPYRPQFGGNLSALLFSLADEDTGAEIADRIKKAIARYEPRAEILSLQVRSTPDYNSISVRIEFRVINTTEVEILNIKLNESLSGTELVIPPAVLPPVDAPEQVNFEGMILTADSGALATAGGVVLIRTILTDSSLTTQDGLRLLTQDSNNWLLI